MAQGEKGTEFALCLNSANRDTTLYPEPNDFPLDLKDRYDMQMMVLGSFECAYNQWTIELPWSRLSFDVGLALPNLASRQLTLVDDAGRKQVATLLPAPSLTVYRSTPTSKRFQTARGIPHGLGPQSLDAFPEEAVRIQLASPASVLHVATVSRVISETELEIDHLPPTGSLHGLLLVASANTRTFLSPLHLCAALNSFCRQPWLGLEALATLQFHYTPASMTLHMESRQQIHVQQQPDDLLATLGLHLAYPTQISAGASVQALHFPRQAIPVEVTPGNYDPASLRGFMETRVNSSLYLQIPPPVQGQPDSKVIIWGAAPVSVQVPALWSFHPAGMCQQLQTVFSQALGGDVLRFSFEDDRFVIRLKTPGLFRIIWPPPGDGSQHLPLRFGFDDSAAMVPELQGVRRYFYPSPTHLAWPTQTLSVSAGSHKRYIVQPRPKMQIGSPFAFANIPQVLNPSDDYAYIQLGLLPLETFVSLLPGSYKDDDVRYGVVDANLLAGQGTPSGTATRIRLLPSTPAQGAGAVVKKSWTVNVIPCSTAAVNFYFSTPSNVQWNRLAEIFGFHGGANCWDGARDTQCQRFDLWQPDLASTPYMLAPFQWNFDPPSYLLLDLGLQRTSATITHRCGDDVLTQFFCKLPLMAQAKVERMTPMQAVSTGTIVISRLHIRLLNPWHQLYHLHGRDWSLTLVIATATQGARSLCP